MRATRNAGVKVHVNQHVIRANATKGTSEPPLRIIRGSRSEPAYEVELIGRSRVVYSPLKPLKCGARVWIEAADAVAVVPAEADQETEH